ncbi:hypothetical protein BDY19DRAFT_972826 [Irpex rosettiformis]|uniref:Uncharacterized protein n=1 Tax=Irpex rosettiformis TaxID=378272 RepID=A0ACB8TQZ7_9APHY|nr:hypothetical protein BDY19DRAFT_972826 [Irpex rosettiformis]
MGANPAVVTCRAYIKGTVHRLPQVCWMRASTHKPLRIAGDGLGHSRVQVACPSTRKESGRLSGHVVYVAARFELLRTLWHL